MSHDVDDDGGLAVDVNVPPNRVNRSQKYARIVRMHISARTHSSGWPRDVFGIAAFTHII